MSKPVVNNDRSKDAVPASRGNGVFPFAAPRPGRSLLSGPSSD